MSLWWLITSSWILAFLFMNRRETLPSTCTSGCRCKISNISFVINCSYQGHTRVPDLFELRVHRSYVDLYLNGNSYCYVMSNSFYSINGKIRILELQDNSNPITYFPSSLIETNRDSLQVLKLENINENLNDYLEILFHLSTIRVLEIFPCVCQPVRLPVLIASLISLNTLETFTFPHCGISLRGGETLSLYGIDIMDFPIEQSSHDFIHGIVNLNSSLSLRASSSHESVIEMVAVYYFEDSESRGDSLRSSTNHNFFPNRFRLPSGRYLFLQILNVTETKSLKKELTEPIIETFCRNGMFDFKNPQTLSPDTSSDFLNSRYKRHAYARVHTVLPCRCHIVLRTILKSPKCPLKQKFCKEHEEGKLYSLPKFLISCLFSRRALQFIKMDDYAWLLKTFGVCFLKSMKIGNKKPRRRYEAIYKETRKSLGKIITLNLVTGELHEKASYQKRADLHFTPELTFPQDIVPESNVSTEGDSPSLQEPEKFCGSTMKVQRSERNASSSVPKGKSAKDHSLYKPSFDKKEMRLKEGHIRRKPRGLTLARKTAMDPTRPPSIKDGDITPILVSDTDTCALLEHSKTRDLYPKAGNYSHNRLVVRTKGRTQSLVVREGQRSPNFTTVPPAFAYQYQATSIPFARVWVFLCCIFHSFFMFAVLFRGKKKPIP